MQKILENKKNDDGQISIIKLNKIRVIEKEVIDRSSCYNVALVGGILTGGFVALVGYWSTPSDAFAGLIITSIAAGIGAGIGALIGSLSGFVITKTYVIAKGEWKIAMPNER